MKLLLSTLDFRNHILLRLASAILEAELNSHHRELVDIESELGPEWYHMHHMDGIENNWLLLQQVLSSIQLQRRVLRNGGSGLKGWVSRRLDRFIVNH